MTTDYVYVVISTTDDGDEMWASALESPHAACLHILSEIADWSSGDYSGYDKESLGKILTALENDDFQSMCDEWNYMSVLNITVEKLTIQESEEMPEVIENIKRYVHN